MHEYFTMISIVFLLLLTRWATAQLQGRMDIPIGVPDLDDKFSRGLANYIGIPALPGASTGQYGDPISLTGRSNVGADSSNSLTYNDFPSLPGLRNTNRAGMTKWYGPDFAPPVPNSGSMMMPNMQPPPPPMQTPQNQVNGPVNDGSVQVTDLSCQKPRAVIGMSNDRNHWLSTVECECRPISDSTAMPQFSCYSLCDGPPRDQRCEASFSILSSCPLYKNCQNWTQSNDTDSGAISCRVGNPVPEAVCWILASSMLRDDDRPLRPAFYANAATGCYMACLCGNDGTVAGEIQCLDRPTSHWRFPVYPRNRKFNFPAQF
ncbi:uncharacterized protein LOC129581598 [Paramacrobiotus metropolitanus]|uniref:uncharacterized protein LOC129581598 n=1 Tax=Paramacrobiotus metropolitanus TaxID=2943436 RepID=UPI0024463211|nr:uncharacterized protein LOC129581598 [Paramacrobiotus metropolitanus]